MICSSKCVRLIYSQLYIVVLAPHKLLNKLCYLCWKSTGLWFMLAMREKKHTSFFVPKVSVQKKQYILIFLWPERCIMVQWYWKSILKKKWAKQKDSISIVMKNVSSLILDLNFYLSFYKSCVNGNGVVCNVNKSGTAVDDWEGLDQRTDTSTPRLPSKRHFYYLYSGFFDQNMENVEMK